MYNSLLKYYVKALLGRKNDMWYFDELCREYNGKYNREIKHALEESLNLSKYQDYESRDEANEMVNSLFKIGDDLRKSSLLNHDKSLKDMRLNILLHIPPIDISVGANSWLRNLQIALTHMGITVKTFWDDLTDGMLIDVNYIIGIGSKGITDIINWRLINEFKKKSDLKVCLQCTFDVEDTGAAQSFIEYYKLLNIDFFFSFDSKDFNKDSGLISFFRKNGTSLFSIEFSANPLLHYPTKYISEEFDFIFLGSSNYDKVERYNEYFTDVFKEYKGLVAGPGWPWSENYELVLERDRYLYSRAKIALNLHLVTQIKLNRQLNERAYIIAACGVAQVTDNPKILPKKFNKIGMVTSNKIGYMNGIREILSDKSLREDMAFNALHEVYEKHTVFHRIEDLLNQISVENNA